MHTAIRSWHGLLNKREWILLEMLNGWDLIWIFQALVQVWCLQASKCCSTLLWFSRRMSSGTQSLLLLFSIVCDVDWWMERRTWSYLSPQGGWWCCTSSRVLPSLSFPVVIPNGDLAEERWHWCPCCIHKRTARLCVDILAYRYGFHTQLAYSRIGCISVL